MPILRLAIELTSPALLAAAPPASNLTETLPYIPGNSVRGLLATRFLDSGRSAEESDFGELFVTGPVRFGNALPRGAEVLPLSARSCKYSAGFQGGGGHGVRDLLLHEARRQGKDPTGPRCGVCSAPLDYFEGFWRPHDPARVGVETVLRTRTAIDSQRGTARTGQLFTQRLLVEDRTFVSRVEAPDRLVPRLEALLAEPFEGRVGTGASRGQGWVKVGRGEEENGEEKEHRRWGPAKDRFDSFHSVAGRPVLAVTLLSDALFRDPYLRDVMTPSLDDLAPLGLRTEDWTPQPVRAFSDVRTVFGFDGDPVSLPRVPRVAVAAGSTFLFHPLDDAGDPEIPAGNGVGWIGGGQREGYGRAVLWHPFHLDPDPGSTPNEVAA